MGRINNKALYGIDHGLSLDDFLLGSNADDADKTQNYLLRGIFSTFKTSLNLASLEYIFAGGSDPDLDHTDLGYFTTNTNQTLAGAITTINLNKSDLNSIDITSLLTTISGNVSSFVLRLSKPSAVGQIFYFTINSIVDNTTHYTIGVTNFVGGNSLEDETTYTVSFDLSGVPSVLTEDDPIFLASPAAGILAGDITNWNTAFAWGNHASAGYQAGLGGTGIVKSTLGTISYLTDNSTNWNTAFGWGNHAIVGYLTSESDPVFLAHAASGVTALRLSQWDAAFGWGNHASVGYITGYTETDPIFIASPAFSITNLNKTEWSAAYGWGDHAVVGYLTAVNWGDITGTITSQTDLQNEFVNVTGDTMTGNLTVPTLGFNTAASANANDFLTFMPLADSILVDSNTTASTNYPSTFGQTLFVRGATTNRSFALHKLSGDNSSHYIGNYNSAGLTWEWNQLWHSGNDGAGSGLDADTVQGFGMTTSGNRWGVMTRIETTGVMEVGKYIDFHNTDASATDNDGRLTLTAANAWDFNGTVTADDFISEGEVDLHGAARWFVSVADTAHQRADARDSDTTFSRLHWYGVSDAGVTSNFRHAWYDGASYIDVTAASGSVTFGGDLIATGVQVSEDVDGEASVSVTNSSIGVNSRASLQLLGQGNNFWIRNWGDGSVNANETEFLSTAGGSTFMFTPNNTDVLQMTSAGLILQGASNLSMGGTGSVLNHNSVAGRDKIRVWNSSLYTIGMDSGITFGAINNEFAMTFQMNTTAGRGWWWGNSSHTDAQGAMSLDNIGKLTVASYTRIGYGVSDTTVPGTTYMLQVNGNVQASNFTLSSDERLKTNIKDLPPTALSVRWRKFDWIDGEKGQFGVVAQELRKDHPEFVIEDEQGMLGVKYTDLLIAKMAEKDRQIADLESRMEIIEKLLKLRK